MSNLIIKTDTYPFFHLTTPPAPSTNMNRTYFYTQLAKAYVLFNDYRHRHSNDASLHQALEHSELPDLPAIREMLDAKFSLAGSDTLKNFLGLEILREKAWWAYVTSFISRAKAAVKEFTEGSKLPEAKKEGFAERYNLSKTEAAWLMQFNCLWLERNFFEPLEFEAQFVAV